MDSGLKEKQKFDGVYFDLTSGDTIANGADGTPQNPLNTESEVLTVCTAKKLKKIYVRGRFTVPDNTVKGFILKSNGNYSSVVDFNGKDTTYTVIDGLDVMGDSPGSPKVVNAHITGTPTGIVAWFENCYFECGIPAYASIYVDCTFETDIVGVDFNNAAGFFSVLGGKGGFIILNMTNASSFVYIQGVDGLKVVIDASCTNKTDFIVGGNCRIVNNSALSIQDYTNNQQTKALPYCITAASATLRNSNDAEKTTNSLAYAKIKETIIDHDMAGVRIKFDLKTSNVLGTATAAIYKNGAIVGTPQTDATGIYAVKSEDLTGFVAGDKIQIWAKISNALYLAKVQNFRFYYDMTEILSVLNNDP
jgi:hypothetical protein